MPSPARWLAAVPHVIVTVLMLVAMTDMLAGVFLRYVMTKVSAAFDLAPIRFFWVEEVGEFCLAWMSFIGAAIGIRRGIHFSVQIITDRIPARARLAVFTAHYLLIAGFGALVSIFGWQVAELNSRSFGWRGRWPGLHATGES
jgi:TRAP-type C4-dicarboxylate transport system permease small subunit